MSKPFKYLLPIFIGFISVRALAIVPDACRRELDETYNTTDEAALNIALQNLGLCLELEVYPRDVKDFLTRESACIHIAGEEPYSGERAVELERLNRKNNCDSTSEQKEALLKKYRKDQVITRALKDYGNKIYPGSDTTETPAQTIPGQKPAAPEGQTPPAEIQQQNNDNGGGII